MKKSFKLNTFRQIGVATCSLLMVFFLCLGIFLPQSKEKANAYNDIATTSKELKSLGNGVNLLADKWNEGHSVFPAKGFQINYSWVEHNDSVVTHTEKDSFASLAVEAGVKLGHESSASADFAIFKMNMKTNFSFKSDFSFSAAKTLRISQYENICRIGTYSLINPEAVLKNQTNLSTDFLKQLKNENDGIEVTPRKIV